MLGRGSATIGQRHYTHVNRIVSFSAGSTPLGSAALSGASNAYLADRNANPKRYIWKAEGADILEKMQRARAALGAIKAQVVNGGLLRIRTLL